MISTCTYISYAYMTSSVIHYNTKGLKGYSLRHDQVVLYIRQRCWGRVLKVDELALKRPIFTGIWVSDEDNIKKFKREYQIPYMSVITIGHTSSVTYHVFTLIWKRIHDWSPGLHIFYQSLLSYKHKVRLTLTVTLSNITRRWLETSQSGYHMRLTVLSWMNWEQFTI